MGIKKFSKKYYLDIECVKEMHQNNMIIGSHSLEVTH